MCRPIFEAIRRSFASLALVLAACGGDDGNAKAASAEFLQACDANGVACKASPCIALTAAEAEGSEGSYCTSQCSDDADCKSLGEHAVCSLQGHCVLSCDAPGWVNTSGNKIACMGGKPKDCQELAGTECDQCGCRFDGDDLGYCDVAGSKTCLAFKENGATCSKDVECKTLRCVALASGQPKVCNVRLGEACTEADCPRCISDGTTSYCSTSCDDDAAPVTAKDYKFEKLYVCVTDLETNHSWYKPSCRSSPVCQTSIEECLATRDQDALFCDPKK